jgi:hypothetical protein
MRRAALIAGAFIAAAAIGASGQSSTEWPGAPESPDIELGTELGPDPGSSLPDEPAKGLVLVQCNICHGIAWIERSGANLDGWTERIRRMIRAGAQIPPEQVPLLADYLARALPERPRPPPPPPKHASARSKAK